jgi:Zn-dependent protease with chaperone function
MPYKILLCLLLGILTWRVDPALRVSATPTEAAALNAAANDHTSYTLPPAKLASARTLEHTFTRLHFGYEAWNILQLGAILFLGLAARMRTLASRLTAIRWLQLPVFCLEVLLLHTLLNLPLQLYAHHVLLAYGLSIQPWRSWALDGLKALAIFYMLATLGVMLLFRVMRWSPRRWWLWFAAATSLAIVAGAFATPYVYDPLFSTFTPLQQSNPDLVADLEKVVSRASGVVIPPDRMFLMKASDKVTTVNAYVTGFGASKRVVVWDTSLTGGDRKDLLAIFAHEMGHYVLNHVPLGIGLTILLLLVEFWLGYHAARLLIGRFGPRWQIASQQDWAALAVFLLILSVFSFLTEPLENGVSRSMEHNADVYGQEALHGIVADPAAVTAASFQHLGEQSLDDPDPSPWVEFWTYNHPSTSQRAAFAKHYHPWADGNAPKYFPR